MSAPRTPELKRELQTGEQKGAQKSVGAAVRSPYSGKCFGQSHARQFWGRCSFVDQFAVAYWRAHDPMAVDKDVNPPGTVHAPLAGSATIDAVAYRCALVCCEGGWAEPG
jgi:hypothetical protein